MFQKYIYSIFFSVIFSLSLHSQNELRNFTLSIVDTLDSEYNQAKDIYTWITENVEYDVNKYKKFDYSLISASDMVSRKKGICSDYANLFKELCKSVNIEAYEIYGYAKFYENNNEMPFLNANHAWNALYVDSKWIICDATYGSGELYRKPGMFSQALYLTTKKAFANNKFVFIPKASDKYFDIKWKDLIQSHYPLDPKWLLDENPTSFNSFAGDTEDKNIEQPNFLEKIEEVRGTSGVNQHKVEGEVSAIHNPLNYYNIAIGYLHTTEAYDIEKEINANNLWQFEKYHKEFNLIYNSITTHKTITDSVYRSRFRSLKTLSLDQKRLTNKIRSKTKSAQNSFRSKQSQIVGKNNSYKKKLDNYIINIGRTKLKFINTSDTYSETKVDSSELNELLNEISTLEEQESTFIHTIDSIQKEVHSRIKNDAYLDDSIIKKNTLFNASIIELEHMIQTGNEAIIRQYVDSLKYIYLEIASFLNDKKNSKKDVEGTGRKYYTNSAALQKNLKQRITLFGKALRVSNYSDYVVQRNNETVKQLINTYNTSIEFTKVLSRHSFSQKDIRKENFEALKNQRKSIIREHKFFLEWYKLIFKEEKAKYENQKLILKSIRSTSQKSRKMVEMKIKKYKSTIDKTKK